MAIQLTKLAATFLILTVTLSPLGSEAQTSNCNTVTTVLSVCRTYMFSGGPVPVRGSPCCNAVNSLAKLPTRGARQAVCACLNKITALVKDAQIRNAARLPRSCGASIPFSIKRNIDCSRVK